MKVQLENTSTSLEENFNTKLNEKLEEVNKNLEETKTTI